MYYALEALSALQRHSILPTVFSSSTLVKLLHVLYKTLKRISPIVLLIP